MTTDETTEGTRPVLRVIRGDATPEEIAALLAVVMARGAAPAAGAPAAHDAWLDRANRMRQPLPPGPGAWRASTWPR